MPLSGRPTAGLSTIDQSYLRPVGSPPPTIDPRAGKEFNHSSRVYQVALAAEQIPVNSASYINMNPEIAKSYVISPTNQGQRAAIAARESMMYGPRANPSQSQKNWAYTDPLQQFGHFSTWNNQVSSGRMTRQPSVKAVSPFSRLPIPTRMPWDL